MVRRRLWCLLVLWNNLAHCITITGIANISSVLLPYNSTFTPIIRSKGEKTIADISAMAFIPGLDTTQVLLLADRAHIYSARLEIKDARLQNVDFLDDNIISLANCGGKCTLDTEGLAIVNHTAFVSTEPPKIIQCPLNKEQTAPASACLPILSDGGGNPFLSYLSHAVHNKGFESLCVTVSGTQLVTGTERWLKRDEDNLVRLSAFDHKYGTVSSASPSHEFIYKQSSSVIGALELVELVALDQRGLGAGGQFLSLERGWTAPVGNIIRLFLVSTLGATDVKACLQLNSSDPQCGGKQTVMVTKEMVFEWSKKKPLGPQILVLTD